MSRWSHPFLFAVGVVLVPSAARAAEPDKLACIAANDAAQDLRRAGKLRDAREKLALCVSASCPGPVRDDCGQRLVEVDAAMPSVMFDVKDAHGLVVTDARVQLDGQPFVDHVDARAQSVDPGSHRLTFDAANGAHAEQTIVLHEKEKNAPVVIVLSPPATTAVALSTGSSGLTTQKTVGVAVGGAGVVGLVVGAIFGAMALSDASGLKSQAGCPSNCPPSAQSQLDTLHFHQWASDIGLGLGVVGLAVGAVLFFTSHAPEAAPATSLRFDVGPGVAGLRGWSLMGRRFVVLSFAAFAAACQAVTGSFSVGEGAGDSGAGGSDGGGTEAGNDHSVDGAADATADVDAGGVDAPSPEASSCTCTPEPPTGWTLVAVSTTETACAGAWGGSPSTDYDGLTANAATCGCTCAASPAGCSMAFSYYTGPCSYDCSGGCAPPLINLTLTANTCVSAAVAANIYQSLSGPTEDAGASCAAHPSTSVPPIAWAHAATSCSPTLPIGEGTCGAGNACVPAAPSGFRVCAEQTGDQTCPFGTKQLEYAGASDSRGCSACTCGAPSGFACGGSAVGFTSTDCSGTSAGLVCGPAFNSVEYTAAPTGTCAASTVSATGSATPTGPVTFCCL